jgi:DNA-directed RNA polymerase specialized sigma24 family protein
MRTLTHYTPGYVAGLVEAAQAGETSGLVEYISERLWARAVSLSRSFNGYCSRLDAEDIRQEGILRALERLHVGLNSSHVVAYLLRSAYGQMFNYCLEQRSLIRVPHTTQNASGVRSPWVDSLDAPLPGEEDLTLLDVLPAMALAS